MASGNGNNRFGTNKFLNHEEDRRIDIGAGSIIP
jgi:hypothetical protein